MYNLKCIYAAAGTVNSDVSDIKIIKKLKKRLDKYTSDVYNNKCEGNDI